MIFLQGKPAMQSAHVPTAKPTSTNSSLAHQPSITTSVVDEVDKPVEVEDNTSHQSTNQEFLVNSFSSTSTNEEMTHVDMDEVSLETTLYKEGPQKTNPLGNPQPIEEIQPQENIIDVSKSVKHSPTVIASSMGKNNHDAWTAKNTNLPKNPRSQ